MLWRPHVLESSVLYESASRMGGIAVAGNPPVLP